MSAAPRFARDESLTHAEIARYYSVRAPRVRQTGAEWRGPCPLHQGTRDSFAVDPATGAWTCHSQCGRGGSIFDFEMAITGMDFKRAAAEVRQLVGRQTGTRAAAKLGPITAEYSYTDESGNLLFQCVRYDYPVKEFRQRRPDGRGGWIWKIKDQVRLVLYHLPRIASAQTVLVVEGEKDVHGLENLGFVATTSPMGAGKWRAEYAESLAGKDVVIFPDNDEPGRKHAEQVARSLAGRAHSVKTVAVPTGKDVSDWIAAGATRAVIETAITAAPVAARVVEMPSAAAAEPPNKPNLLPFLFNDHGNSERLIAACGRDMRYCFGFQKWLVWDGRRWKVDAAEQTRTYAKRAMLEFLRQAIEAGAEAAEKKAKEALNSKRITDALRESQSTQATEASDLDTKPYLLNFLNGTVDVRTGQVFPHSREHLITKLVNHNYNPRARAPKFEEFLARIMAGNPKLIGYLKRAFGYSLTGVTSEKAVFLLHGVGDNGKSTLLSIFLELLEEYSVLLQIDSLMVRQESNNTQADLADLRGARFVMTSETEEGQRLAEGKLKRITQGMGRIKATRKYENPITFTESHKLWIDANHLPQVRGTDNAIWNRLHPIPFAVTIPKEEQIRDLRNRLLGEAEGILAWAVQGAMEWHQTGLGKPFEVEQAGAEWRGESDQIGRFIEACCIKGDFARSRARELFLAYRKWIEEVGERTHQNETNFFKRLLDQGFEKGQDERGKFYRGLGLKA